jgi:hypothetical protein
MNKSGSPSHYINQPRNSRPKSQATPRLHEGEAHGRNLITRACSSYQLHHATSQVLLTAANVGPGPGPSMLLAWPASLYFIYNNFLQTNISSPGAFPKLQSSPADCNQSFRPGCNTHSCVRGLRASNHMKHECVSHDHHDEPRPASAGVSGENALSG